MILERLCEGIPLAEICRQDDSLPAARTVNDWMNRDEEFSAAIARAREVGFDVIAVDALRIADTPVDAIREVLKKGGKSGDKREITREDALGHRRLQVETRLKLLAKWDPKRYGERLEHASDPDAPLFPPAILCPLKELPGASAAPVAAKPKAG